MSDRARNIRVGIFVIAGISAVIAFVAVLGGGDFLARRFLLETYFLEPVTGLAIGSPLRYRGVKIGSVKSIGFAEDYYEFTSDEERMEYGQLVSVLIEAVLRDESEEMREIGLKERIERIERLVELGLRLRIAQSGITGTAFIQGDIMDPEKHPPMKITWEPQHLYVPSAPSTLARLTSAAEKLMERLAEVDIESIAVNLEQLLENLEEGTDDLDLGSLQQDANLIMTDLRTTLEQLRDDLEDADIEQVGASARAALDEATAVLVRTRGMIESGRYDLGLTLENLRVSSENLRDLTATLRAQPSLLIRGEAPKALDPGEQ